MIKFKDDLIRHEFYRLDKRLMAVIYLIGGFARQEFKKDITITCAYRGDSGTHKDWRAVDMRTRNLSSEEGDKLVAFVNDHIDYGDGKHFVIKDERLPGSSQNWTAPH
ncbi:hypothetical protein LCGC14_1268470, partial [marine sediment metagenome]